MKAIEILALDATEPDNQRWKALVEQYAKTAASFEIHCWNEETEWIALALQYGNYKQTDWAFGKIVSGSVTPEFLQMLLGLFLHLLRQWFFQRALRNRAACL